MTPRRFGAYASVVLGCSLLSVWGGWLLSSGAVFIVLGAIDLLQHPPSDERDEDSGPFD